MAALESGAASSKLDRIDTEVPVLSSLNELQGKKRIVLVGGSFDPPQIAHVMLADSAALELKADAVLFMPAARNPLKEIGPHVSDSERVEMLKRALQGHEHFYISKHELELGGASFTVSTLRDLRAAIDTDAEVFLVVGADCLTRLNQWKEIDEVLKLASLRAASRKGFPTPEVHELAKTLGEVRAREILGNLLSFDGPAVSSTEVRAALQEGHVPYEQLDPGVADFISARGLYRCHQLGSSPKIDLDKLLVVRRLSKFELHKQQLGLTDEQLLAQYRARGIDAAPILACHETLERGTHLLEKVLGAGKVVTRDALSLEALAPDTVVVALGGDDHFKHVAQFVGDRLVLAVNPDPWRSDGALTSCMSEELPDVLDALTSGNYTVEEWTRLEALLDGKPIGQCMSEVRLSESDVDDMSHHRVCQGDACAEQKGSGLLVATGAGSTGWFRSAGRYQFPHGNEFGRTERLARYILREPHSGRLLSENMWYGEVTPKQSLLIESLNDGAATISFDAVRKEPFLRGAKVELRISEHPLRVIKPKQ